MAIYIVLDVETCPHPNAEQWLDPVVADGRLTDPEKIKADLAKKRVAQLAECSLDPDLARICALGYYVIGGAK